MPHIGGRHFRRASVAGAETETRTQTTGTQANAAVGKVELGDVVDGGGGGGGGGGEKVVISAADTKLRTSALAGAGPTQTAVPKLVDDWKAATVEAAAKDAARAEMAPALEAELAKLETQKGEALTDDERELAADDFFDNRAAEFNALVKTYVADMSKSVKDAERTVQKVVADMRSEIGTRRDPFTPIALRDPVARSRELVLWESAHAMVVADLFAPVPKALVVPKQQTMFLVDATKALVDELALLAAHVSDAFMATHGTQPAGIWVNAPQDVTVKQLHVHVMPDLPRWAELLDAAGIQVRGPVARNPAAMQAAAQFFDGVGKALEQKLGPST